MVIHIDSYRHIYLEVILKYLYISLLKQMIFKFISQGLGLL